MTERASVGATLDVDQMADEMIDEIFANAPAQMSEPGPYESPAVAPPALGVEPAIPGVPAGDTRAILVNLRYTNETILLHDGNGKPTGEFIQFYDGRAIVPADQVAFVQSAAPYVYVEPADGHLNVHPQSGFSTRNGAAFAQYCLDYANNQ